MERASETGAAKTTECKYGMPNRLCISGGIITYSGVRKITCRVSSSMVAFMGWPLAWK